MLTPVIHTPFEKAAMNLVGPLVKSAMGHIDILILIDYATRYPKAVPLRNTNAKPIARQGVADDLFLGFRHQILTDHGPNFITEVLQEVWQLIKVKALKTAVYHPEANGLMERFDKT